MEEEKILVFGSDGMLGKYLCNMLEEEGYDVIKDSISNGGTDVTKEQDVEDKIYKTGATHVVNCVAYTNVDGAEENKELAYDVNANAPTYMAKNCKRLGIPFIHISTDYIFGDNKKDGYTEDCTDFNPLNVYGKSKLEGEKGALMENPESYIFRTSWLFGPNATNFIEKITTKAKQNPEISVVTDEIGCPTYVGDLSRNIHSAIKGEIAPGIYHSCSSDALSRYEFAKEILSVDGINTPIKECHLNDFPRKAKVPNTSILINTKLPTARTSMEMLVEYKKENEEFKKEYKTN